MNGVTLGGAGAGKTSEAPPSLARLHPGQRVGGDVYGLGRGHLPPIQARGGHLAADGWTCLGARLRRGHSINGLAGLARPNHAQATPTKEVMQLLVQLLPSSITLALTRTRRDVSPTFRPGNTR